MRGFALAALVLCSVPACTSSLPCGTTATAPAIPGASVSVSTDTCTVSSGSPVRFTYETSVTTPLSFMTQPHAGCTPTLNDPSSFITANLTGTSAEYCPTCSVPTCSEDPGEAILIPTGTYMGNLMWPGLQWSGPGDDGNTPLGGPFPAGDYNMDVVFQIPAGMIDARIVMTIE